MSAPKTARAYFGLSSLDRKGHCECEHEKGRVTTKIALAIAIAGMRATDPSLTYQQGKGWAAQNNRYAYLLDKFDILLYD